MVDEHTKTLPENMLQIKSHGDVVDILVIMIM